MSVKNLLNLDLNGCDEEEIEDDDEEEEGKAPLFVVVCLGESFSIFFLLLFQNYSIAFLVYCC